MDRRLPLNRTESDREAFPSIIVDPPSAEQIAPPSQQNSVQNPVHLIPRRPVNSRQRSSIRIRRVPSASSVRLTTQQSGYPRHGDEDAETSGRRRSTSEPQPWHAPTAADSIRPGHMDTLQEETPYAQGQPQGESLGLAATLGGRARRASSAARSRLSRLSDNSVPPPDTQEQEYDARLVDLLDVVDPEVSTLTTLTNVQNSLFVPDLGRWLNRRPTYELSRRPTEIPEVDTPVISRPTTRRMPTRGLSRYETAREKQRDSERQEDEDLEDAAERMVTREMAQVDTEERPRRGSITSVMSESHYAVLPHGASLEGWSEEDKRELNDHVRHFLHSRRSKYKRRMRAFGKYVRKPLGFFVTLYAVLITLFGLAWVLFLIGWINVAGRQSYLINVIDNVLVALFAIMGDGLAPFRAVDTYHMCFIAHYHHLTWRLRREQAMPKLQDDNDLPKELPKSKMDLEAAAIGMKEVSMLNPLQQKRLEHHQQKFSKSHSFYKPHETTTHHAFPLRLLVAVVCLLDCHSLFQIALGTCTWAISYHVRPQALTATILCCSIACNITAGIVITIGDRKTRKKDVIKKMFMQELTEEAMQRVRKRKTKEKERSEAEGLEAGQDLDFKLTTHSAPKSTMQAESEKDQFESRTAVSEPKTIQSR